VTNALLGLVPVVAFLVVLVFMDSFKLVRPRSVVLAIVIGGLAAAVCSPLNAGIMDAFRLSTRAFSRYGAPLTEETLKAAYVAFLIRRRRVGFLVDAAIQGFAVGAGFALVENATYLLSLGGARPLLWVVRGSGTAMVHGSATAIFAMLSKTFADRRGESGVSAFLPGMAAAVGLHSLFNHFVLNPLLTTALLLVVIPLLMVVVFERSRSATRAWLSQGLNDDVEFLGLILSGSVGPTRAGSYLRSLKDRFPGTVVADMLCLVRINLELSLRGKGLLIARDAGLELPVGEDVTANLEELRYLEHSIGRTGLLAVEPLLRKTSRDLWHLYVLGKAGKRRSAATERGKDGL
jgi:RsiW-degrading membrane proteinase PrsW (M82 family)